MRAIVTEHPGGPDVLRLRDLPVPAPRPGHVLIRVHAFGLNRSELFTRRGQSPGVAFPRVQGIEAVGVVEAAPGTRFSPGQKVAAIMGGMGRAFDGGYAEYTLVPATSVFALRTDLDWATLGAIPEMFQTVHGSLTVGLDARAGQTLLVRGGTSSVGMTATRLAKTLGLTVLATTRRPERLEGLRRNGADHALLDAGVVARAVRDVCPGGVDSVLELVGAVTLLDSLRCARRGGVVCMTGILGDAWTLRDFTPMEDIPTGVRLTSYSGAAEDLDEAALQAFVDDVTAGRQQVVIDRVFAFDDVPEAHRYMEGNHAQGKLVVRVTPPNA